FREMDADPQESDAVTPRLRPPARETPAPQGPRRRRQLTRHHDAPPPVVSASSEPRPAPTSGADSTAISLVAWASMAMATTVLGIMLVGGLSAEWRLPVVGMATLTVSGATVLLVLRAAEATRDAAVRRAWRWLAAGLLLVIGGDGAGLIGGPWGGPMTIFGVSCVVLAYPCIMIGLRCLPSTARSTLQQSIFWLDTLIVLVGAGLVLWYLVA